MASDPAAAPSTARAVVRLPDHPENIGSGGGIGCADRQRASSLIARKNPHCMKTLPVADHRHRLEALRAETVERLAASVDDATLNEIGTDVGAGDDEGRLEADTPWSSRIVRALIAEEEEQLVATDEALARPRTRALGACASSAAARSARPGWRPSRPPRSASPARPAASASSGRRQELDVGSRRPHLAVSLHHEVLDVVAVVAQCVGGQHVPAPSSAEPTRLYCTAWRSAAGSRRWCARWRSARPEPPGIDDDLAASMNIAANSSRA